MPSYCVKALENTQSILGGLFLVCEHFCSGRTASHRTALSFRGIFVLLDAGGLSPAKEKRAKSAEKTGCPACVLLLIDAKRCEDRYFHFWVSLILGFSPSVSAPCAELPPSSEGGFFNWLPLTRELAAAQPLTEGETILQPCRWPRIRRRSFR